jgi:hypothetical protein
LSSDQEELREEKVISHGTTAMVFMDFPDSLAIPPDGLSKVTSEKGQQEKGSGILRR